MGLHCLHAVLSKNIAFSSVLGYISANGSEVCTACPAGYACPDSADPSKNVECAAGSYSAVLTTVCTVCPAGSYCPINE